MISGGIKKELAENWLCSSYIAHHSQQQEFILTLHALVHTVGCVGLTSIFSALPQLTLTSLNLTQL